MKRRTVYLSVVVCVALSVVVFVLVWVFHGEHSTSTPHNSPVQQTATALPHNERQVLDSYNHALIQQDWATMYTTAAKSVLGNSTLEEFVQTMEQQVKTEGIITSITVTSNPKVKVDADGMTYFTVFEKMTVARNGTSQNMSIVSLFILENNTWKYFTSKKI